MAYINGLSSIDPTVTEQLSGHYPSLTPQATTLYIS